MRSRTQLHNGTALLIRCLEREIHKQINLIPTDDLCRIFGCNITNLPQQDFLCKEINVSPRSRMVGKDFKAQLVIRREEHGQQIPCGSISKIRGEIADPNFSIMRLLLCRTLVFHLFSLHRLSSSQA